MSIRWRLTLRFALILSAILILSGTVLHILLERYLNNQIDGDLGIYSARLHGTLDPVKIPSPLDYDVIHSQLPAINEFSTPGVYVQMMDRNGNVLVKSNSLGEQELPVDPSLVTKGFNGMVALGTVAAGEDARVRIMVSPLYLEDQVFLLEVAQSLNPIDTTMNQVRWAILANIILALILATVLGGIIVRGVLAPVSKITRIAKNIELGSDLNQRVGYDGPTDEIGDLATTFDHMIEQLGKVFQSQKNFVADASHELRGPLTVIRGNLDLLSRQTEESDREESQRAIASETARMTKIVEDLLLLAEVESGKIEKEERVSLKQLLMDSFKRAKQLTSKHKIMLDRQEDLTVAGDFHKLMQALDNLVDNAIRYTPSGSAITLSLFQNGEWACLEVSDTGGGIPAEHLPLIFDRFYRVDKARSRLGESTGLGLSIVKGIAEQFGGKVGVTSEPGKGSIFTIRLKL